MAFGFLKKIAKGAGKVLGGVGDVVKKAAPLAGLIPGVGTIAGGAIGGIGGLLGNLNDKDVSFGSVLKNTAGGAAGGAAGGLANKALLGGKGISALPSLFGRIKGGLPSAPGASGGGLPGTEDLGGATGGPGGGGSLLDFFKNPANLAKLGVTGAGLLSASKQSGKANAISDDLLAQEQANAAKRGALGDLYMQGIQTLPTKGPNLASSFVSRNPFARKAA